MRSAEGKKIVLLTVLPSGTRLASLRTVERIDSAQVVFETSEKDRSDTIPAKDCIAVKGGEDIAGAGLGLGIREVTAGDLGGGEHSALEAFELSAGAPLYVVRGKDAEERQKLADALYDELPEGAVVLDTNFRLTVEQIDPEMMRACGWVRREADDSEQQKAA